jgi:cytochrome b6-f complex iron-sulfur subunit
MSEPNRRDFLLAAGVAAVALVSLPVLQNAVLAAPATAPTMPDTPVDVGLLSSYSKDGVTQKFAKKPNYIFIVRKDGKLYACLSMCTHRYVALTVKEDEFYCPKHKSEFTFEGTVTHGPAKNSLPRYAISVGGDGHVVVDCSKEFSETQWDDPKSFVVVR